VSVSVCVCVCVCLCVCLSVCVRACVRACVRISSSDLYVCVGPTSKLHFAAYQYRVNGGRNAAVTTNLYGKM